MYCQMAQAYNIYSNHKMVHCPSPKTDQSCLRMAVMVFSEQKLGKCLNLALEKEMLSYLFSSFRYDWQNLKAHLTTKHSLLWSSMVSYSHLR